MIELRTFDGDPRELADFCTSTWRKRYAGQRMPTLTWTGDFLDWELFADDREDRHFLVAAYDGTKLVGALPARPISYTIQGQRHAGTLSSYFSVDPDYETQAVALKLNLELCRRHRQREFSFSTGFVFLGASAAKGKEFWSRQPRSMKYISKVGLWARVLDHRAVAKYEFSSRDRWAVRALGTLQRAPNPKGPDVPTIRPFEARDLGACLRLTQRLEATSEFSYVWDEKMLMRQLSFKGVPRTLVAEENGQVAGFLNYCHLDLLGQTQIQTSVIDLVAIESLSRRTANQLIRRGLQQMQNEGCHVALLLRTACYPKLPLIANGFVPQPAEYYFVAQMMGGAKLPENLRRFHVHWR
ncbi:hypothetical protein Poly24_37440 [Rosistilla carotiformis]|uniref:N-acetyltransferase domain-containing protein n=1 Tax=Rosistilla carotiformis TaxID=2528017 RepID=A0A518JWV8_9BACT|nr:hypothetical protein [Rosistilla carotiformis]QDV70025.1 hypothetical protein Poly24_37440 [Rosistilla carotiformis]